MARGRFLNASIAVDIELNSLSLEAHWLYMMTIPHLDRDGLIVADTYVFFGKVCPRRPELIPHIDTLIDEWATCGLVTLYSTRDGKVAYFHGFTKNQQGMHYSREGTSILDVPPGYIRTSAGLIPVEEAETQDDEKKDDDTPDEPTPDQLPTNSGLSPAEVKDQVKDQDQEGESAPARAKRISSPHLDPRHFVNGRIPPGKGTTAVEVYYERFDIRQDAARLSPMLEDDLVRNCKDLEKLRKVVIAYSQHQNYRVGNVALILDWYRDGIPKKDNAPSSNGVHKNGTPTNRDTVLARARMGREKIKTAELTGMPIDPQWLTWIEAAKEYA